jgi:hypothetical protein
MIIRLLNYLETITWRHAAISALMFVPFLVATLVFWGPKFAQQFGVPVLDLALGLNGQQAYDIIGKYGEVGRQWYLGFAVFDIFLPAFGALMLLAWWSVLIRFQWPQQRKKLQWVLLIGLAPMGADWLENIGFISQVLSYPTFIPELGTLTLFATRLKVALLGLAQGGFVLLLLVVMANRLWQFFRKNPAA